jgi:hypothetical protein
MKPTEYMNTEVWKDIEDFPDYQVSSNGRVRSSKYNTPRILKESIHHQNGRPQVVLRKNNKSITIGVHRLVCKTFNPNPHNHPYVLHKDNNVKNNRSSNLKWGTQSENIQQSHREGRQVWNNPNPITFILVSPQGDLVPTQNLNQFGRDHQLDHSLLSKVCLGKRKQHKGWTCQVCPLVL